MARLALNTSEMTPPRFEIPRCGRACLTGLLALAMTAGAQAAGMTLIGNWFEMIGTDDLVMGAGTDFRSTIETGAAGATLGITNTQGAPWTLWVRRDASTLPAAVSIAVHRTSDGTGNGSISGGTDYLMVQDYEQLLFQGSGDRSGINLQLRVAGISISQGPGAQGCNLIYRLQ